MAAPMPVLAAPQCLANGKSVQVGQTACLTLAGQGHLARCDIVLNNTSWTKLGTGCPENARAPHVPATPISTQAPSPVPAEPTEN